MEKYREDKNYKMYNKYLKIWMIAIIIITILFYIYTNSNQQTYELTSIDKDKINFIKNTIPSYPPPLLNFM